MKGLPLLKEAKKMTMQHVTFSPTCMQRRAFAKAAPLLRCDWHFSYARLQRHSEDIERQETCKLLQRMIFDVVFFSVSCETCQKMESFHFYLFLLGNQSSAEETVAHAGTVRSLISNPAPKQHFGLGPL